MTPYYILGGLGLAILAGYQRGKQDGYTEGFKDGKAAQENWRLQAAQDVDQARQEIWRKEGSQEVSGMNVMHDLDCQPCLMLSRFKDDWCHAGGIRNWRGIGLDNEHSNYGWPHYQLAGTTNCAACGKETCA